MLQEPFYNPDKSYEENFAEGPYGAFATDESVDSAGQPAYDFFGHKVHAPFGIPAGPLINGRYALAALRKGFDIVTYKTVRTRKYPSHPWPNVLAVDVKGDLTMTLAAGSLVATRDYCEPLSITNSFGVPSSEPEYWQKDIADVLAHVRPGQAVIGAFQGTKTEGGDVAAYIRDFRDAARELRACGVKIFEVNLSCPNEGTANLLCYDTARSLEVVKAIKAELGSLPLIIKIGYFQNVIDFRDFLRAVGPLVDGISAINTIASEIVDREGRQALPGAGRARSGVCGASIKWAGLEMIRRLKEHRAEMKHSYRIIGVGGVMNADDFHAYREAGADAVMSATGAMWNPYLARDIKQTLA